MSQIFWLGICELHPRGLETVFDEITSDSSSRPVEDVALQLISYSHSYVNNCCAVGNNAVYVDHRRSGSDRRAVQRGSIKFPNRAPSLSTALSVGSLQVILHSICMEQRANKLNSLIIYCCTIFSCEDCDDVL